MSDYEQIYLDDENKNIYLFDITDIAKCLASIVDASIELDEELDYDHPQYGEKLKKVHSEIKEIASKYDLEFDKAFEDCQEIAALINLNVVLDRIQGRPESDDV